MLTEIWSSAFIEKGVVRNPIKFRDGLNVVLGSEDGANSIGKSSLLLVIDFVFGGNSYLKSDAVAHLDNHEIFFTFTFNGKPYYFCRNIKDSELVTVCDPGHKKTEVTWTKNEFCDWLKNNYQLDFLGLSFRETLSSFFRVYGKENANEWYPLQGIKGRGMKDSIDVLVKLWNLYSNIDAYNRDLKEKTEKAATFKNARNYKFLPNAVQSKAMYEENLVEIKNLESELESLSSTQISNDSSEYDSELITKKAQLESQKNKIELSVLSLKRRLERTNISLELGLYPTEADLETLQEYFPSVNIRKLYEVEGYHKKLAAILDKQLEEEKENLEAKIAQQESILSEIRSALDEMGCVTQFSQEFLQKHSELLGRINLLKAQNDAFVTNDDLQAAKKKADNALKDVTAEVLKEIEDSLNETMKTLNDALYVEKRKPPHIHFNAHNSYNFETPDDKGTGSNFKGMLIYDLAVLQSTALPAIVHDSFLFKNISDGVITGILKHYNQSKKQIFIALDKSSSYGRDAEEILNSNKVIVLGGDHHELYGDSWNKE